MANIEPFENHPEQYEDWFSRNKHVYKSEIDAIRELMPVFDKGIEIGIGSGRFALPLGIGLGLEPSARMGGMAKKRGLKVVEGVGENIPFDKGSFDLVLMVTTLCFLDDAERCFNEIHRILEYGGIFINGFVDKDSDLGKVYQRNKKKSMFYNTATFYSVDDVKDLLIKTGFEGLEYTQTIFRPIDQITKPEIVKKGYGKGSFVVISARKQ